jgi:CheY-like chemotaxis protein
MDSATTVLLAEDNPDEAMLMQRAFKMCGLQRPPHIVRDGLEAIAYIKGEGAFADRATHPFPHIVILDLKMPKASGFEVLKWLKEHQDLAVIPTIVWSSSSDVGDVKRAYCLGANGYLCKPVDFQEFKTMVGEILRYWNRCLKPEPNLGPTCADLPDSSECSGAAKK